MRKILCICKIYVKSLVSYVRKYIYIYSHVCNYYQYHMHILYDNVISYYAYECVVRSSFVRVRIRISLYHMINHKLYVSVLFVTIMICVCIPVCTKKKRVCCKIRVWNIMKYFYFLKFKILHFLMLYIIPLLKLLFFFFLNI